MKPMLASDWEEAKVRFPRIAMPKLDGVRGLNMLGSLTGRSLKSHKNRFTTKFFSRSAFIGFDGELAAQLETHPDLCRITTSALNTIEGEPFVLWWLFDYVAPDTRGLQYIDRLKMLDAYYHTIKDDENLALYVNRLRLVPWTMCESLEELLRVDEHYLDLGYEGTIIRDPFGMHKQGRSTPREGGLLRIKRFVDAEAVVTGIVEGETNCNEAQMNELGLQFRSTHKENMLPNGQVGSFICRVIADVYEPTGLKRRVLEKDQVITVSPGRMPVNWRKHYFENPHEILEQVIKFKFFPKGGKDKPRFPTFQTIRSESDMGGE